MQVETFYDARTSTLTHVVYDADTKDATVLDPVLDFDAASGSTWTDSVEKVIQFLNENQLKLHWALETHAHADHLSGSPVLKEACPAVKVAIGSRITAVQEVFKDIFNLPDDFRTDGSQFDRLLDDGEVLEAGSLRFETMFTPGHTPACASYRIEDALFTGDALFMPDSGTGRCDFPGGSARDLYHSIQRRIYTQPGETQIFVGHDYQPGGREVRSKTTVAAEKEGNVALRAETSEAEFIRFREQRDATLAAPKLLFHSVQVNVDAGRLPKPEGDYAYLKIPLNAFKRKEPTPVPMLDTCEAPEPTGRQG
jgi:glyoxylase-like metal-dependent hydrolase (beta-lactamase superfamily II)